MDDRARPFDRSLLEATMADAARAAEVGTDTGAAPAPPAQHEVSLPARASLSSVATLTAGAPRHTAAAGPLDLLTPQAATPPRPAPAQTPPAVAPPPPAVTPPPPAAPPVPAAPGLAAVAPPDRSAANPAAPPVGQPAAQPRRSELRPWQPSDDDLLPSTATRRRGPRHR